MDAVEKKEVAEDVLAAVQSAMNAIEDYTEDEETEAILGEDIQKPLLEVWNNLDLLYSQIKKKIKTGFDDDDDGLEDEDDSDEIADSREDKDEE